MDLGQKAKSFWEKPEGKTGMIFAAGGIVGLLMIMMRWGAQLVTAAQNTMILGMYIAIACGIGYVLMDPRFRATAFYAYKGAMRALTGTFIQIDPIGILKTYIDDLKDNHEEMGKQISKLRGTIRILKNKIDENIKTAKNHMALATEAKKQEKRALMTISTRKAGRLQESNKTYHDLLKKMEVIYRVLCKMHENCGILIEDTQDQVEQKETEWTTVRQASSAMKSAMSIINGDKDKRAIYEEALEFMATDLGNKIGEMEHFMEMSENFMDGIDLQNGVFEEKGLNMLEKWEKDADSWILGDDKAKLVSDGNSDHTELDLDAPMAEVAGTVRSNQFNKLFDSI